MIEVPQRPSLVEQVAGILRRGLHRGDWVDHLPGELLLTQQLKVSRPTLRAALEILQREGLIAVSQGLRRKIIARPKRTALHGDTKTVGVLAGLPFHALSSFSLYVINSLQEHLLPHGYRIQVFADPRLASARPERALEHFTRQARSDCWVLIGLTPSALEWFTRQEVPVVHAGSCEERFAVPCVEVDIRAVARHAVGVLLRHGHKRIGLLPGEWSFPPLEAGFREGLAIARVKNVQPVIIRPSGTRKQLQANLETAFRSPARPTALLVARPKHVLTIMTQFGQLGLRFPRDVSLISMAHQPFLDDVTPAVAHYTFRWAIYAKRLSHLTLQLAVRGAIPPRQHLIMPEFVEGETVARPRE